MPAAVSVFVSIVVRITSTSTRAALTASSIALRRSAPAICGAAHSACDTGREGDGEQKRARTQTHTDTHRHTQTHTHTDTHTYTQTHTRTQPHTHARRSISRSSGCTPIEETTCFAPAIRSSLSDHPFRAQSLGGPLPDCSSAQTQAAAACRTAAFHLADQRPLAQQPSAQRGTDG